MHAYELSEGFLLQIVLDKTMTYLKKIWMRFWKYIVFVSKKINDCLQWHNCMNGIQKNIVIVTENIEQFTIEFQILFVIVFCFLTTKNSAVFCNQDIWAKHPFQIRDHSSGLIVLGFNDTSTLEGHFVSSPREREKRDRRESRGDEREGQGRKRNRNESEETEEIKTLPLYPYPLQG